MNTRHRLEPRSGRRVLLVGAAGRQGQRYLDLLGAGVEWAGLVDTDQAALGQLTHRYGLPGFARLGDALAQVDFDTAVVAVPHHLHFPISAALLRAGKHVIKEKPFALRPDQARRLARLAETSGRALYTIVQRRFRPAFQRAHTLLGDLGELQAFRYEYHADLGGATSGWRAVQRYAGGGVVLDMGYHAVDLLNWYFGPPAQLSAVCDYHFPEMRRQGLEDLARATLTYPGGVTGTLALSRHGNLPRETLDIVGSRGTLRVTPSSCRRSLAGGRLADVFHAAPDKPAETLDMFSSYLAHLDSPAHRSTHLQQHLNNVDTVAAIRAQASSRRMAGAV